MSLDCSKAQPLYSTLSYLHRKGNTQGLPAPGPCTTRQAPGDVGGAVVGVVLVLGIVPTLLTLVLRLTRGKQLFTADLSNKVRLVIIHSVNDKNLMKIYVDH